MAASPRITKAWEKTGVSSLPRGAHGDAAGRLVGSYRLVRRIGEGGMGAVYEAAHQKLPRRAAIKLLSPEFAEDPDLLERFFNEARAVNIVQHPDIVSISELGQLADGTAYLVMELIEGEPLSLRMHRSGKIPVAEAARLARQIALALAAAHQKGIVHRDLKPDNVMIVADPEGPGGERAKLLDFGIAKLAEEHQGQRPVKTRAGMVLGTPVYMSPEQCRGAAEVDQKADVYSLGVMLYQMLAGRPPFEAEGEGELVAMHIYEEPQPVKELTPIVPDELSALVGRMLEKDRAARPTMTEVAAALEPFHAQASATAVPSVPLGPVSGPVEACVPAEPERRRASPLPVRRPQMRRLGALAIGAVAALAVVLTLWPPRRPEPTPAAKAEQAPARIRWSVVTEPPGATAVQVADGKVLWQTPHSEERLAGQGTLRVLLRRPGYLPKAIELDLSANVLVREVLKELPPEPTARQPAPQAEPTRLLPEPGAPRRPARAPRKARPAGPNAVPAPPPEVEDFEKVGQRGPNESG